VILEVLKKELCGNPILFVWDGEKAIRYSRKRILGIECDFEEEILLPFDTFVDQLKAEPLEKAYCDARSRLDAKIDHVIQTLAKAADKAKIVLAEQENHVRIVQYTRLHSTFFGSKKGCIMHEIHAFTAEVY